MIHLPLPNQHILRIEGPVIAPAPDLAFDFDPLAKEAVSDALVIREALLHHVPRRVGTFLGEAVEEATEAADHAIQSSLIAFKEPILDPRVRALPRIKEDGVAAQLASPNPDVTQRPTEAEVISVRGFQENAPPPLTESQWLAYVAADVKAAKQPISFSERAATVTLAGLMRICHPPRRLQPKDEYQDPERQAVSLLAAEVLGKYFPPIDHVPLMHVASLAISDALHRLVSRS